MFVTNADFEFPLPPAIASPTTKHWRLIELTGQDTWFLLTHRLPGGRVQTLCIAWESSLATVLETLTSADAISLQRVSFTRQAKWLSQDVLEVLVPHPDDAVSVGPLAFRLGEASVPVNSYGEEVAGDVRQRLVPRLSLRPEMR